MDQDNNGGEERARVAAAVLSGIDAVCVRLDAGATIVTLPDVRLDEAAVEAYAESRLRRVGLVVVPKEDAPPECPVLLVRMSMFLLPDGGTICYRLGTHLLERFTHNQAPDAPMMLPTWTNENHGTVGTLVAAGALIGAAADMVDTFAGQWAAAQRAQ